MVEAYFNNHLVIESCKTTFTITICSKIFQIFFIFFQSFFIFKYANIVIHFGKNTAIIGLMHIICTNFSLFTRTVVAETVSEILEFRHHHAMSVHQIQIPKLKYYQNSTHLGIHKRSISGGKIPLKAYPLGCINVNTFRTNVSIGIQEAQEKISEYLYPCVIEYSLIALTIFYVLWTSLKSRYNPENKYGSYDINPVQSRRNSAAQTFVRRHSYEAIHRMNNLMNEKPEINKFIIDCGKSTTGLFFGIFVILITVR